MEAKHNVPLDLNSIEKRDSELWSIVLILMTAFAAGVILFVYADALGQSPLGRAVDRHLGLLVLSLVSLVLLLDIYLFGKKRSAQRMLRQDLQQEDAFHEQPKFPVTDPLTGVYKRRYFEEVMPRELNRAVRQRHGLAFLLLDVDDFYKLTEVVSVLKNSLRSTDYIFRFGGNEFLAALVESNAGATTLVENRLHQRLRAQLGQ